MKIKQLKEVIKDLPENMEVFIEKELDTHPYSLAYKVEVREVYFRNEIDFELKEQSALVITDN